MNVYLWGAGVTGLWFLLRAGWRGEDPIDSALTAAFAAVFWPIAAPLELGRLAGTGWPS